MDRQRRTETQVAYALLSALREEERIASGVRKTRLQAHVYISWSALNRHLDKLRAQGLLAEGELRITPRGLQFMQDYRNNVRPTLEQYGFQS